MVLMLRAAEARRSPHFDAWSPYGDLGCPYLGLKGYVGQYLRRLVPREEVMFALVK